MDYKQKYEQALERAKVINPGTADYEVVVKIFPELKESKDEKIRKALIHLISEQDGFLTAINGISVKDILAWLTKQDKQKPVGKVEPKFKVGDWIVFNDNLYYIGNIALHRYYECLRVDGTVHTFGLNIDSKSHLWTIQDAKDGDVLATHLSPEGDWIGIYKESVDILGFKTYCFLNGVGEFVINPNRCRNHGTHGLHPATKEQCDILFSKMKEAGYEWDAEKKELKKIEQKPAAYFYCKYGGVMPLCSDCKRNHLNSKYKTEEIETWMVPALRCTKQCFSYIQQKSAWSEEDEKMSECCKIALEFFEELGKNTKGFPHENYFELDEKIYPSEVNHWLKSLKERVNDNKQ